MASELSNDIVEIAIQRGANGFGLNIKGGKDQAEYATDDGIFIASVKNSSINGTIKSGDKLLEINGITTEGLTHDEVLTMFSRAPENSKLKILRGVASQLDKPVTRQLDKDGELSCLIQREIGMPITWEPREEVRRDVFPRGREWGDSGSDSDNDPPRQRQFEGLAGQQENPLVENQTTDESSPSDEDEVEEANKDDVNESSEEVFRRLSAENRIENRTVNDENLPPTVSLLHGEQGQKIYLIGTAHFSKESCDDVRNIISQTQPDVVVIELCRGRADLLTNDEETLSKLAGEVTVSKVLAQIRQKGVISGLMTFLLLHMSAHITKQLGMAPGGEFRAAYKEARCIPGCKVMFGDRSVEVTLQRAFGTLYLWQKLKFALQVLKDLGPIKPEDIEKLKEKDVLEQALGEMMGQFPKMTKVFLEERDTYLAYSIQLAAANQIITSSGVSPTVVVGVVGLGHAAGVQENFHKKINREEMEEIMTVPKPSRAGKVFKICFRLALLLGLGYGLFSVFSWVRASIPFFSSNVTNHTELSNVTNHTEL